MSKRLYVGNLSWSVDSHMLNDAFAQHGNVVSAQVVTDRETGRSKGFGFVEMSTQEEAEAARENLDGQELDGRPLRVDIAHPREERPPRRSW